MRFESHRTSQLHRAIWATKWSTKEFLGASKGRSWPLAQGKRPKSQGSFLEKADPIESLGTGRRNTWKSLPQKSLPTEHSHQRCPVSNQSFTDPSSTQFWRQRSFPPFTGVLHGECFRSAFWRTPKSSAPGECSPRHVLPSWWRTPANGGRDPNQDLQRRVTEGNPRKHRWECLLGAEPGSRIVFFPFFRWQMMEAYFLPLFVKFNPKLENAEGRTKPYEETPPTEDSFRPPSPRYGFPPPSIPFLFSSPSKLEIPRIFLRWTPLNRFRRISKNGLQRAILARFCFSVRFPPSPFALPSWVLGGACCMGGLSDGQFFWGMFGSVRDLSWTGPNKDQYHRRQNFGIQKRFLEQIHLSKITKMALNIVDMLSLLRRNYKISEFDLGMSVKLQNKIQNVVSAIFEKHLESCSRYRFLLL